MLGLKICAILAACTYTVFASPAVVKDIPPSSGHPPKCTPNEFYWKSKSKAMCLPIAGPDNITMDPPKGACPSNWHWHLDELCAPLFPTDAKSNECPKGHTWNKLETYCVPGENAPLSGSSGSHSGLCKEGEFMWELKSTCLATVSNTKGMEVPPHNFACPDKWYWSSDDHCAPSSFYALNNNVCPIGYHWNNMRAYCKARTPTPLPGSSTPPTSDKDCPPGEFFWTLKPMCLTTGGANKMINKPPTGRGIACPSHWDWHANGEFCAPGFPTNAMSVNCPPKFTWKKKNMRCEVV